MITQKMEHLNHPNKSKGFHEIQKDKEHVFHAAPGTPYVKVRCLHAGKAVRCRLAIGQKGKEAKIAVCWALAQAVAIGGVELLESAPKELKPMIKQAEEDLKRVQAKKGTLKAV